ncbi:isoleucine--tRNA ligase, chloroplastic/mitochondrial-like isoform X2 [Trifolium pratense]|uniref:isoleucine--tRNA ligase, chloroplastic/mitochondrial-like isoform X2 n=1 Tax=Trifolium pratense TaxID=57577 RepID=UPI001E692EC3|nr:isoleucine--tRNA ligase, chloroplastic/mitochondrial-like isoform X2 [Trifolium pratense]XP_045789791.1 isoleucine--tRNA ligase, chloroplastic/mitochondrial-like isoform X2 [Trifolium pratense]XP_045789792.1 isoleucine--tRNA ligase, chloroplastic/mitochondrial-like isoform X2 [Trifolium pratense]XP_045789793.1 isoleucine--tRNA ligase, chloroplastic/mitochondrial-like isoform X2 [Trifolium pratense]XP_045789794.1 isoleucine--tRNA ligase, chloroplastic/mitochondrial-like isoform X2 [Trifolium 
MAYVKTVHSFLRESPDHVKSYIASLYPEGHILRSIYAIFRVASAPLMSSDLLQEFPNLCLAIWTTTPRTIPANAG